jgi:hypothetical protein
METVNDIFNTIASTALAKHGVTDPNWIEAIAAEHRKAFADLGVALPPPGLVELLPEDAPAAPGEDLDMSPRVVIPAAEAGPRTPVIDPAQMSGPWRVLMLLALLESPEVTSMGFTAHAHDDGEAGYTTLIEGPGFGLLVEWRTRRRGQLEWARLVEVRLPAPATTDGAKPRGLRYKLPWLAAFRFTVPFCEQAVARFLESGRHRVGCGKWWPSVATVTIR